jgi:hypothetical protein
MGCQWTFRFSRENDLIMNGVLHDELLPYVGGGVKIISIRRCPFAQKNGLSGGYKT